MHAHFTHPWLLWSLALLPLLRLASILAERRRTRRLIDMAGLTTGIALARARHARWSRLGWGLGMTLLGVGMAGPRWGRDWTQSAAPGRDLVVVVDGSRSMFAEAPSRIERVREMLLSLADGLRRRGGHRLALVVFAGSARLACPLTHDLAHFRECVQEIDVSVPDATLGEGTRIGAGLDLAIEAFAGRSQSARDVLLLSDGDDPARDGEYRTGIARAKAEGVAVHVIGVGDADEPHRVPDGGGWLVYNGQEVSSRMEAAPLREISRRTGGRLVLAGLQTVDVAEQYLSIAGQNTDEDSPDALPVLRQRQEWFLLGGLAMVSLGLVFPLRGGRS